jgi:hypothetical protein
MLLPSFDRTSGLYNVSQYVNCRLAFNDDGWISASIEEKFEDSKYNLNRNFPKIVQSQSYIVQNCPAMRRISDVDIGTRFE